LWYCGRHSPRLDDFLEETDMIKLRPDVLVAALVGALALGCASRQASRSTLTSDTSRRRFEIRTDSTRYTAERVRDAILLPIGITYLNHGVDSVYVAGCWEPDPPELERREAGGWRHAYTRMAAQCLTPPVVIPPGKHYRYVDSLRLPTATARNGPTFQGPVAGTYRLQFGNIYDTWAPNDTVMGLGELMPDSLRLSNEFQIREP
jgi:hypothetical protein